MQNRHDAAENDDVIHLSVIVPAYNEAEVLPEFHNRLSNVLKSLPMRADIIYVNDGSRDRTAEVIGELRESDSRIGLIDLSRNFGKEVALTAGLDHAQGDMVIVIDADLQDPPELIPELIKQWEEGYDVVYAKRIRRKGETALKKITAAAFYRLMQHVGPVTIPRDTGDFRLLSRRAVEAVKQLRERHRFMKGIFAWVGYPQKAVPYERDPRYAGETKWSYWRLWNFALEGITAFTVVPLKLATYVGVMVAIVSFSYGVYIILKTLIYGADVAGYPSLMVIILFLGGLQLIAIGILGEYLGRMFNETKDRPLYLVQEYLPAQPASSNERDNIML